MIKVARAESSRPYCPAKHDICHACQKHGHWAKCCFSTKYDEHRNRHLHTLDEQCDYGENRSQCDYDDYTSHTNEFSFNVVDTSIPRRNEAYATLRIQLRNRPGLHNFTLKVDTGAQANTMPFTTFRYMFPEQLDIFGNHHTDCLQPTENIMTAYNGTGIACLHRTVDINCSYDGREWRNTKFFVVDVPGAAILGLSTCEALHVVTLHCELSNKVPQTQKLNNIGDLMQQYPQQFDRIGELQKTHKLVVDPNVPPRIDPPRRTPIALKDKIKSELDKMVDQRIIRTIEEPTYWVSSLTYVTKRDGSIRVCLDPRQLNKALIRPRHQAPTLDDLNHKFANAKFFSKLDAKAGYWSIKLDEESQKLTTFQTPFGRYCFSETSIRTLREPGHIPTGDGPNY